ESPRGHPRVQSALKLPGDVAVEVSDLPLDLAPVDDELDTSRRVLDRNSIEYLPRDEVVNAVLSLGELIVHAPLVQRHRVDLEGNVGDDALDGKDADGEEMGGVLREKVEAEVAALVEVEEPQEAGVMMTCISAFVIDMLAPELDARRGDARVDQPSAATARPVRGSKVQVKRELEHPEHSRPPSPLSYPFPRWRARGDRTFRIPPSSP